MGSGSDFSEKSVRYPKAPAYEKDGFTWMQNKRLQDLSNPERMKQMKAEHAQRLAAQSQQTSNRLRDILEDNEEPGCAAYFV